MLILGYIDFKLSVKKESFFLGHRVMSFRSTYLLGWFFHRKKYFLISDGIKILATLFLLLL